MLGIFWMFRGVKMFDVNLIKSDFYISILFLFILLCVWIIIFMYCCGLEMKCYMLNLVKNMKFIFVRVKIYIIISDENLSKLICVNLNDIWCL